MIFDDNRIYRLIKLNVSIDCSEVVFDSYITGQSVLYECVQEVLASGHIPIVFDVLPPKISPSKAVKGDFKLFT